MNLNELLGQEQYNKFEDFIWENCDDSGQLEIYLENFYPFTKEEIKDFLNILDKNDLDDLPLVNDAPDELEGNDIYNMILSINSGEDLLMAYEYDEYIRTYILNQYTDTETFGGRDVYDFFDDYGGMSIEEMIESDIKYSGDSCIDKLCQMVYVEIDR